MGGHRTWTCLLGSLLICCGWQARGAASPSCSLVPDAPAECHPFSTLLSGKQARLQPPVAPKRAEILRSEVGDNRLDDWFWLRDDNRTNPEVLGLLERENVYTDAMLGSAKRLRKEVLAELKSRIPQREESVPQRSGGFWYYSRREPGQQYPVHCRRPLPRGAGPPSEDDTLDTRPREQIVFNENKEAAAHAYFDLGGIEVTLDHKYIAFGIDTTGSEMYDVYVQDIQTGQRTAVSVDAGAAGNVVWANDNQTLFFTTKTMDSKRPNKVWRYQLGQDPANATLVFEEPDESFYLGLGRTRSDQFLTLSGHSEITRYLFILNADTPQGEWKVLAPNVKGRRTYVTHRGRWFYAVVSDDNQDTLNGELLALSAENPTAFSFALLPHSREVQFDDITVSANHLVLLLRKDGNVKPFVYNLPEDDFEGSESQLGEAIPLHVGSGEDGQVRLGTQGPFDSDLLRLSYSDLRTPPVTLDVNLVTGNKVVKKKKKILGGYNEDNYKTDRIWATASDGVRVPVSLVYRPSALCQGANRLLLYAYGAYGSPDDPQFDRNLVSLLDRGFVYAAAHVRGGGDLGRYWYEDGKLLKKKNTFTDFIACAEHLITLNYTRPDLLTIWGASAGGLTMGAVVTMRPELFRAAILDVPFVDVMSTMSDESLPLTTMEFEEWGDPIHNKTFYRYMENYSPYDNVRDAAYPHMFVTAGLNDNRVSYWEPAKFVQRVRDQATNNPLVLFKINMGAGHFGVTGIYDALEEEALKLTFLLLITCAAPPGGTRGRCMACTLIVIAVLGVLVAITLVSAWQLMSKMSKPRKRALLRGARRPNGAPARSPDPEKDILMGRPPT